MLRIEVKGLSQIARAMRELPNRVDRKVLNDGLAIAATMVRDEARTLAPELSSEDPRWRRGTLKRAIRIAKIPARRAQMSAEVIVRVRRLSGRQIAAFKKRMRKQGRPHVAARLNPLDPFYWIFQEFGTARHAAKPFLRPAFEAKKQQAVDAAIKFFRERVQLELAKIGRTIH